MSTQNINQSSGSEIKENLLALATETIQTEQKVNLSSLQNFLSSALIPASSSSVVSSSAYHEMAEIPVKEVDQIELLNRNLATLEDLQGRLSFMMREVRYHMKM